MSTTYKCIQYFLLAVFSVPILIGCSGKIAVNPTSVVSPLVNTISAEQEYRILPGDQLDIKFFYNSELNESVVVRSDGRISLQLAGEIVSAGRTPAELTAFLQEKYTPVLVRSDVTVIVKASKGQKVFVDGEVQKPGIQEITGPITIRRCVAEAGGLKETARTHEILVIRQRKDMDPLVVAVNLETFNSGSDFSQDIHLLPYDIVYVPRSPIANADLWVKQYITGLLPFSLLPAATW